LLVTQQNDSKLLQCVPYGGISQTALQTSPNHVLLTPCRNMVGAMYAARTAMDT
jgi:hypothetical protein